MPIKPSKHSFGSIEVGIEQGNVLEGGDDVIVNAASITDMQVNNWGRIAGKIKNLIDDDPNGASALKSDWNKKGTKIEAGTADFVTQNGKPYKFNDLKNTERKNFFLIHAGSPKFDLTDPSDHEKLLINAYSNVLKKIHNYNSKNPNDAIKSVGMVALGIGIYDIDPKLSVKCAAKAIDQFSKINPNANIKIRFPIFSDQGRSKVFADTLNSELHSIKIQRAKKSQINTQSPVKLPAKPITQGEQLASIVNTLTSQAQTPAALQGKNEQFTLSKKTKVPSNTINQLNNENANTALQALSASLTEFKQTIQNTLDKLPSSIKESWKVNPINENSMIIESYNEKNSSFYVKKSENEVNLKFGKEPKMTLEAARIAISCAGTPIVIDSKNLHDIDILTKATHELNNGEQKIKIEFSDKTKAFLSKQNLGNHSEIESILTLQTDKKPRGPTK